MIPSETTAEPPGHGPRPPGTFPKPGRRPARYWPLLGMLLFLGAMFWAKEQDPFSRRWFTLKTDDHHSFDCVAVLPKPVRRCPVIVYAHGAGGSLMEDGMDLRQMAELGLAAVSLQYDQTNDTAFAPEWTALLDYLGRQTWADTNVTAWVGFSLGANQTLAYALQHPERTPQLLVQISGAGLAAGEANDRLASLHCPVLLVHGGQDGDCPAADTQRLAATLQTNGRPIACDIISGAPHDFGPDRGVVFRSVGEYCLRRLAGPQAWAQYHSIAQWQAEAPPLWLFFLPAAGVAGWLVYRSITRRRAGGPASLTSRAAAHPPLTGGEIALRWGAVLLAVAALTDTALHVATPHLPVSPATLTVARRMLVLPKEQADFAWLTALPVWRGVKLQTLLDHAQLANYNRSLVNWQVDDSIYRQDVLSPVITGTGGEQFGWRRPLWEEFYPRIRHEAALDESARVIVRHLRERVTIAAGPGLPREVPEIWRKQITDETGFAVIYVAALRSAGVPARLDARARAEFWDGDKWQPAPGPAVVSW